MRPFDPRLLRHVPRARAGVVLTVALGVGRAGLAVAQALLLAHVLAAGFRGVGVRALAGPLAWLGVVLLGRGLLVAAQDLVSRRTCAVVQQQLRSRLLERVAALGPDWLAGRRSGELATLAGPGLGGLEGYFRHYLPQLVLAVVVPAAVVLALLATDWRSAAVVGLTVPLLPLFLALVGMHTQRETAAQWRALSDLGGHFLDVVTGLPTLRAHGRGRAQVEVLRTMTTRHRQATMRALRTAFLSSLVLELVATLSVAVLAVSVGFRLLAGDLAFEQALVVLLLAPEAFLPLRAVGTSFHAATEGLTAATAAFEVLDAPLPTAARGARRVRRPALHLEDVTVLRAGRDEPALDRLSLSVAPGEQVALLGPSGCGKSTLLGVLLGFVPVTSGTVLVDGVDLRELDLDAWREQVAWVPQAPHLLARSVADNVRLGRAGASDAEVAEALRAAGADFVDDLPHGAGTVLGERGHGLSVGQARRVALARAFLRDAPLLLLDEPTAGLDSHSEQVVAASLERLARGRTVLLATHRTGLLSGAHRVVPLERAAAR